MHLGKFAQFPASLLLVSCFRAASRQKSVDKGLPVQVVTPVDQNTPVTNFHLWCLGTKLPFSFQSLLFPFCSCLFFIYFYCQHVHYAFIHFLGSVLLLISYSLPLPLPPPSPLHPLFFFSVSFPLHFSFRSLS